IGYSIALAIYGPFTFYFITQPLNPHAMWAVGKVRSGYLDTYNKVRASLGVDDAVVGTAATTVATNANSSPAKPAAPVENKLASVKPSHLDLLLSTDVPSVDKMDWGDRMSNFKDMQIGYEENMVFAARMGRLEQVETQLNFPLIADSAYQEIERYLEQMNAI